MKLTRLIFASILLSFFSCNKDDEQIITPDAGGSNFGTITSAVVIVNPIINQGSTTTVQSGTAREGVTISVDNLGTVTTDATGLAVINGLPTGIIPLNFSSGFIDLNVIQDKELYDVVVSYADSGATQIIPAVRYPIGGTVVTVKPGDDLNAAAKEDNVIIFMEPGVYEGDVLISSRGVLLFGAWDEIEGSTSIINGTLTVNGGDVRMRGVTVNNITKVNANGYSAAFCEFNNAEISGNTISLLRNKFNGTIVSVPSSTAVLLDNENLP
ncbi:MAG: hypothetical protein OEW67_09740 [Cyclobacteriaceae bacterium]|nr:hypothetical protein [Cyclobacteriaceae bacterium]